MRGAVMISVVAASLATSPGPGPSPGNPPRGPVAMARHDPAQAWLRLSPYPAHTPAPGVYLAKPWTMIVLVPGQMDANIYARPPGNGTLEVRPPMPPLRLEPRP